MSEIVEEALAPNTLDLVEACVEGVEAVANGELVIVAEFLHLIVVNVQPLKTFGDESKIEPTETVGGDIEPAEIRKRGDEAVEILQLVVVQSQGS